MKFVTTIRLNLSSVDLSDPRWRPALFTERQISPSSEFDLTCLASEVVRILHHFVVVIIYLFVCIHVSYFLSFSFILSWILSTVSLKEGGEKKEKKKGKTFLNAETG